VIIQISKPSGSPKTKKYLEHKQIENLMISNADENKPKKISL
jgi:hypothetical protein